MFYLRLAKARILEWVLDAMMNVVTHATFNCSDAGLSIEEPDTTGLCKVTLFLPPVCFESYHCHRNFAMRLNIKNALKILKYSGYNDILALTVDDIGEFVTFMFENPDQAETATFKMKRMNVDFKDDTAEIEFDTIFRISSHDLAGIWGNFHKISDTVGISVSKNCVQISGRGDVGNARVYYRQNSRVYWPEDAFILEMKKPVSSVLDIRHFQSFMMGLSLSSEVIISMSSGLHVLVEYKVAKFGRLRFYLPTKEMEARRNT